MTTETDLIAELAEVVRLSEVATPGKWSVEDEGKNEFGQREFTIEVYDGKCPIVGTGAFYGDPDDANECVAAVNFLRNHHATLTRIIESRAEILAAHEALVIRLGEVTTMLEAERARIAEAPAGTLSASLTRVELRDADMNALPLNGKRVALVVLEDGK